MRGAFPTGWRHESLPRSVPPAFAGRVDPPRTPPRRRFAPPRRTRDLLHRLSAGQQRHPVHSSRSGRAGSRTPEPRSSLSSRPSPWSGSSAGESSAQRVSSDTPSIPPVRDARVRERQEPWSSLSSRPSPWSGSSAGESSAPQRVSSDTPSIPPVRDARARERRNPGRRSRPGPRRGLDRPREEVALVNSRWIKRPAWESVLEEMGNPIVRADAGRFPHRMAARIAPAIRSARFRGEGRPSPHPSPAARRAASAHEGLAPPPVSGSAATPRPSPRERAPRSVRGRSGRCPGATPRNGAAGSRSAPRRCPPSSNGRRSSCRDSA